MNIKFRIKSVCGEDKMYLADDVPVEIRSSIFLLTGCKTLRSSDKLALEVLGFTFTQVM